MKTRFFYILIFFFTTLFFSAQGQDYKFETGKITFSSQDSVLITGDLYIENDINAPFIILFHMARSSRGEYLEIAPKLNKLGFNCLAIDQRSGSVANTISNETSRDAKLKGKSMAYADAYVDVESTLIFIKKTFNPKSIIVWGSSYSADLVLILASKYTQEISGLLSFSPGSYFNYQNIPLTEYVKNITCPVFITTSVSEKEQSKTIFKAMSGKNKIFFIPKKGYGSHGSVALNKNSSSQAEYWKAVIKFLKQFK